MANYWWNPFIGRVATWLCHHRILKSEVGEGWLVVASAEALVQLRRYEPVLHVEKRLTRSRSYDQEVEEEMATERYLYLADEELAG